MGDQIHRMITSAGKQVIEDKNALILFTREPEPGRTKTRMMPYFSPEQCVDFHRCMIKDISREMKKADVTVIVAYSGDDSKGASGSPVFLRRTMGRNTLFIKQRGSNIGTRMQNAIDDVLRLGYEKVILIGTDIPELKAETINASLDLLTGNDVVIGPTYDGGYYLIGMKAAHPEAFNAELFRVPDVLDETVRSLINAGITVGKTDCYSDMDVPEDLAGFRRRMRKDARLRRTHTGRFLADNAKISVIVPVYNEAAEIRGMISQLRPYSDECEIIIVDGGSTDGTPDMIYEKAGEEPRGIHVLKDDKCRAVQMNAGARESTGDILFFLHCDCTLPKSFTSEIHRVMASHDWGCFRVKFRSSNFFMLTNRIFSNHRALCRRLPFGDQGIFIDRNLFFEAGMFPEIQLMEDYEFSMRMRCRKDARGPGLTRKMLITSARRYGRGTGSILRKEIQMWKLRYMYRHGTDPGLLQNMYDDLR